MLTAKLVYLVVNLIENPDFVVLSCVVFHCLLSQLLFESVNYFDLLKVDGDTAGSAAWDVVDFVGLESDLDWFYCRYDR